jgi:hypothetical protein
MSTIFIACNRSDSKRAFQLTPTNLNQVISNLLQASSFSAYTNLTQAYLKAHNNNFSTRTAAMMHSQTIGHTATKNVKIFGLNRIGQKVANNWREYLLALVTDASQTCGIQEIFTWITAFLLIVVGWYVCTDGIFSCIITLASVVQLVGFVFLLMQVLKHGNFENLSVKMVQCYVCVYVCRLTATIQEQGYLPIDASGDWCYQTADACSLFLCLILLMKAWNNHTVPTETFPVTFCFVACFLLACAIHPCENLGTWTDVV